MNRLFRIAGNLIILVGEVCAAVIIVYLFTSDGGVRHFTSTAAAAVVMIAALFLAATAASELLRARSNRTNGWAEVEEITPGTPADGVDTATTTSAAASR